MKDAFQTLIGTIDKRLFNRRAGDLVADFDLNFVVADRQRHVATVDLRDQRTDRLVGRSALEAEQPDRLVRYDGHLALATDAIQGCGVSRRSRDFVHRPADGQLRLLAAHNLQFAVVQSNDVRRNQLRQGSRSDRNRGAGSQSSRDSVRSPHVGSQLVAGTESQLATDGRPAAMQFRPQQHDSLPIRYLADSAVFAKGLRPGKPILVNFDILRHQMKFGDRRSLAFGLAGRPGHNGSQLAGLLVNEDLEHQFPTINGRRHTINKARRSTVPHRGDRFGLAKFGRAVLANAQ